MKLEEENELLLKEKVLQMFIDLQSCFLLFISLNGSWKCFILNLNISVSLLSSPSKSLIC